MAISARCCAGLPLPDKHESLLAEMLFSQMLRLPTSTFKPLAYSALMARAPLYHAVSMISYPAPPSTLPIV